MLGWKAQHSSRELKPLCQSNLQAANHDTIDITAECCSHYPEQSDK